MVFLNKRNGLFGRVWADDDFAAVDDQPADSTSGLASLGYIRGAIRRGMWAWVGLALAGLLLGAGYYLASPPVYQATTTVVLKVGPEPAPGTAIQDEQVVAHSRPVAALALKKLGLQEDPGSFIQSYTVTVLTDQALLMTVTAPSNQAAVTRAEALSAAFLQFRAGVVQALQRSYFHALDQEVARQRQVVAGLSGQIRRLSGRPPSPARAAQMGNLQAQRRDASNTLSTLVQNFNNEKAATEETTAQQVNQSKVVDPAAAVLQSSHDRLKHLVLYAVIGLIAGLVLGLAIVIVRALVSDRLRRRDDVRYALGAPVKLSVGPVGRRRRRGRRGLAAVHDRNVQAIVAQLRREVPPLSEGAATLAVVSVDSSQVAALSVLGLALSCAAEDGGRRVVVADLSADRPAARLLGTSEPGIQPVDVDGIPLVVAIPPPDDLMPTGPLEGDSGQVQPGLERACELADLVLTLVTLDPAVGGDHLSTWATDAVVIVTAGRSSGAKIRAAGEMVRLAGIRLVSAVLVGADKADESLGVVQAEGTGLGNVTAPDLPRSSDGSLVTVDRAVGKGQSASR
jgi:Chain length determinant protein